MILVSVHVFACSFVCGWLFVHGLVCCLLWVCEDMMQGACLLLYEYVCVFMFHEDLFVKVYLSV